MNRAIEIHDSVLDSLSMEGSEAVLRFKIVYIHQTEGKPGWDEGTCWTQAANIVIGEATVEGRFSEHATWLRDGFMKIDGERFDLITVPLDQAGKVELRLEGWQEAITVSGTHVRLELIGEPEPSQPVGRIP